MAHIIRRLPKHLGIISVLAIVSGCDISSNPAPPDESSNVEWIDPNSIHRGPRLHDSLPPELVQRIKSVHATFADVDGTSFDHWMDDFQRDHDPEGNVRIWEDMAVAYNKFLDGRNLPLDTRKEVFKVVLFRSMASEQDVLARIELDQLTLDDAKAIMAGYPAPPKPIDLIRSQP